MEKHLQRSRICVIALLVFILIIGLLGEKVAFGNGYGWDGRLYNRMINSFSDLYFEQGIDKYHMYRVLPFALLHFIYKLFNISQTPATSIYGCWVMNFIFILASVRYYFKLSDILKLKKTTEIIGFSLYFFNYPLLKFMGYCPVMCDTLAYLMATAALYYYVSYNNIGLTVTGVISLFCWPLQSAICWILLFLSRDLVKNYNDSNSTSQSIVDKWLNRLVMALSVLWVPCLFAVYYWFIIYHLRTDLHSFLYARRAPSNSVIMFLSVLSVAAFYFLVFRNMSIDWTAHLRKAFRWRTLLKLVIAFIGFYILYWVVGYYGGIEGFSYRGVILNYVAQPSSDILIFLETPFIYLGLFPILIIVYWKGIRDIICSQLGFSYFIVLLLSLIMLMGIETRCLISFYPIYLTPLLIYINKLNFKKGVESTITTISLILSFFWFQINVPGITEAFNSHFSTYQYFPAQRYYMFMGPWQGHDVYIVALIVELILLGVLYYIHKKEILYR